MVSAPLASLSESTCLLLSFDCTSMSSFLLLLVSDSSSMSSSESSCVLVTGFMARICSYSSLLVSMLGLMCGGI